MVQKYESPVRIYKYPFELVVAVSAMISFAMLNCTPLCKPVALVGRSYTLTETICAGFTVEFHITFRAT